MVVTKAAEEAKAEVKAKSGIRAKAKTKARTKNAAETEAVRAAVVVRAAETGVEKEAGGEPKQKTTLPLNLSSKLRALNAVAAITMAFIWIALAGFLLNNFSAINSDIKQTYIEEHIAEICITTFIIITGICSLIGLGIKGGLQEGIKWSYLMLSALAGYYGSKAGIGGLIFVLIITSGIAGKFLSFRARCIIKAVGNT